MRDLVNSETYLVSFRAAVRVKQLSTNPEGLSQAIANWTSGEPTLTRRICTDILNAQARPIPLYRERQVVDLAVARLVFQGGDEEIKSHLQVLEDAILSAPHHIANLTTLIRVHGDRKYIYAYEHATLCACGLLSETNGRLVFTCKIYAQVFNLDWAIARLNDVQRHLNQRSVRQQVPKVQRGESVSAESRRDSGNPQSTQDERYDSLALLPVCLMGASALVLLLVGEPLTTNYRWMRARRHCTQTQLEMSTRLKACDRALLLKSSDADTLLSRAQLNLEMGMANDNEMALMRVQTDVKQVLAVDPYNLRALALYRQLHKMSETEVMHEFRTSSIDNSV